MNDPKADAAFHPGTEPTPIEIEQLDAEHDEAVRAAVVEATPNPADGPTWSPLERKLIDTINRDGSTVFDPDATDGFVHIDGAVSIREIIDVVRSHTEQN